MSERPPVKMTMKMIGRHRADLAHLTFDGDLPVHLAQDFCKRYGEWVATQEEPKVKRRKSQSVAERRASWPWIEFLVWRTADDAPETGERVLAKTEYEARRAVATAAGLASVVSLAARRVTPEEEEPAPAQRPVAGPSAEGDDRAALAEYVVWDRNEETPETGVRVLAKSAFNARRRRAAELGLASAALLEARRAEAP